MSGIDSTVTVNEQRSVRCCASVATHDEVELPSGNDEPDGGVQVTLTGAAPPVTVGAGNITVAARVVVRTDWLAGQEILGASTGGGFGPIGLSPHAADTTAASSALDASQERFKTRKMRRHLSIDAHRPACAGAMWR